MKHFPPDPEDARLAAEVNTKLGDRARVALWSTETDSGAWKYRLVMQAGSYRRAESSEQPFCFAGAADLIERVERWLGTIDTAGSKWTDDPSFDRPAVPGF